MKSQKVFEYVARPPRAALSPAGTHLRDKFSFFKLSPEMCAELLDPEGWADILETFARTMRLAVALTDGEGRILGACHNPQPVWQFARASKPPIGSKCAFCLMAEPHCTAVVDCLYSGSIVTTRDRAGVVHSAVPLALGDQKLGSLIAGQVFDRYPDPMAMQKLAQEFEVSPQYLWNLAVHQAPVLHSNLHLYSELLAALGDAFLRQRYALILDRKLIQTDQRYRLLIQGAKDYALFTVDKTGRITSWNRGAEHIYGYSEPEIVGKDFSVLFIPEDVHAGAPQKLLQKAARSRSAEDDGWQIRKDGTRFYASGMLASLGNSNDSEFGRILRDVTEHRKAEQFLLQTQKMESVGLLAGGIAHDFNNLLAGILFSVSSAKTALPPDNPAFPMLELAEQSTEKAAALTHQLLAYAGKGKFDVKRLNFSALISEMLSLINTSIPKQVKLQLSLPFNLPWIEADASQIQQIVMNLVINGAEAIGPEGGTVRVATGVSGIGADRMVFMEVQDSGSGMSEATKARIFDPFFTTKTKGRGLGLAAVSGIIRSHNGKMEVESVLGEGTTFKVFFPAVEPSAETQEVPPAEYTAGVAPYSLSTMSHY